MSGHIKTGEEILSESEKDFSQKEWYSWKNKKWVPLSFHESEKKRAVDEFKNVLIEQLAKKQDERHDPTDFNTGYHDAMIDVYLLLEEK